MPWVSVDENTSEWIYEHKPVRNLDAEQWFSSRPFDENESVIHLPGGSICKLIGRVLTWSDEPVELVESENKEIKIGSSEWYSINGLILDEVFWNSLQPYQKMLFSNAVQKFHGTNDKNGLKHDFISFDELENYE